jgi:hypothetical protein
MITPKIVVKIPQKTSPATVYVKGSLINKAINPPIRNPARNSSDFPYPIPTVCIKFTIEKRTIAKFIYNTASEVGDIDCIVVFPAATNTATANPTNSAVRRPTPASNPVLKDIQIPHFPSVRCALRSVLCIQSYPTSLQYPLISFFSKFLRR